MSEKPRVLRKHDAVDFTTGSAQQLSKTKERSAPEAQTETAGGESQPTKSRAELESKAKLDRSLARACARAEQELRRRDETVALVMQHGSDMVFRLNREGKILELSAACSAMLGVPSESLQGRAFQELVLPAEMDLVRRYLQSVLRGSVSDDTLVHIKSPNEGARAAELHCRAVPHPQTQQLELVGIARLAPRATSRDDLAFSLAHELNQPLTALAIGARACSRLAQSNKMDPQELTQALDQLALQAERAGDLVRRMRQLAVRGVPSGSKVTTQDLINDAMRFVKADLDKEGVVVKLQIAAGLPNINVDRIQMEQVLVNLIRNAMEAMCETPAAQRVLTIAASVKDAELVMAITDTGRGFAPGMAERLFQPYQSTKPQGMGLGLAISRAILQAHAGRIWAEPASGSGATFCLALPFPSRGS